MIPEFNKYNSLTLIRENREEEIQRYKDLMHGERCYVTEKIHGANFEVVTDGTTVTYGRRNGYLGEGASFYGYQYVAEMLGPKALDIFKELKELIMEQHKAADYLEAQGHEANRPDVPRDFQSITIRGELAGGHYPAKDVPQCNVGHGQVGKGKIWYSQDKSFYAFELVIDDVVQDFYSMAALCTSYGIPVAPVLFFGTFEECLAYSKEHLEENTVVPTMQPLLTVDGKPYYDENGMMKHLPVIEGNQREGHVIAPVNPKWLPNGKRAMFKHKGAKFMESKNTPVKVKKEKKEVPFTLAQRSVFESVRPLLTENRMDAVCSKEELTEPKDFPRVIGLVVQDAIEELMGLEDEEAFHANWKLNLTTKERKFVTGQLNREACELLRTHFFN